MARKTRLHWAWWLLALVLLLAWQSLPRDAGPGPAPTDTSHHTAPASAPSSIRGPDPSAHPLPGARLPAFLPPEAHTTITLIQRGGPFPHRQDGGVFGNREGHLPTQSRGWYREYTVATPGLSHRGARRIVTGGKPPKTWHYTSDHYESFRDFTPAPYQEAAP